MRILLLCLFFCSGAAALIYEVTWTRTMVLVLGNTNLAMGMVLAVFLVNFALGSAVASRWRSNRESLLKRYALLELLIGLFGLVFPLLAKVLDALYPVLASHLGPGVIRLLLCWIVLSVPTFFMGATFPVMNGLYLAGHRGLTGQAGAVYGVQTLGAALGAALAGFFLIRHLGLAATGYAAASMNGVLCCAALAMSRRCRGMEGAPGEPAGAAAGPEILPRLSYADEARASVIYAAVFCNAFAALSLEILWTRILVFFLGGLTYSFTAMLVVYLTALGAGAALLSLAGRRFELSLGSGGVILFLGGAGVCLCLCTIPLLYGVMEAVEGDPGALDLGRFAGGAFLAAALLMLPGALLLGMITPLAVGMLVRERGGSLRESGLVYGTSNLGACLGALAASWFMVPAMGLKKGVMIMGFMVIASGLLLILFSRLRAAWKAALVTAELGVIWFLTWFMSGDAGGLDRPLVTDSHVFLRPGRSSHVFLETFNGHRPCYREGNMCTASVVRDEAARGELRLYVDAFNAAATGPAYGYMRMMAHLPVIACPNPARVLVIGYGTGTTAGSLSLHRGLKELELVEISRAVMEMAPVFSRVNRGVGWEASPPDQTPAVKTSVGADGRDLLNLSEKGFDIITLEPMMPYTPAAVHFYTAEFYALCRKKLNPGGVVCHWIPLNALPTADFKLLLNTFVRNLPGSACFHFEDAVLLLGFTRTDWSLDLVRIAGLLEDPDVRADCTIAGFDEPLSISGAFIADGGDLRASLDGAGIMEDDHTRIEYLEIAPAREAYRRIAENVAFLADQARSIGDRLDSGRGVGDHDKETWDRIRRYELSTRLLMRGREGEARAYHQASLSGLLDFSAPWKDYYEKAFYMNPDDRRAARKYSHGLVREALSEMVKGRFSAARDLIGKASAILPELWEVYMAEGFLNLAAGNRAELEPLVEIMGQMQPSANLYLAFRAELARLKGEEQEAEHYDRILEKRGGLAGEPAVLMARSKAALKAGEARYAVPSVDRVAALLCMGPKGITETGRNAWSLASAFEPALLNQAREILLARLDLEGRERLDALKGLGFFEDDGVRARLGEAYREGNAQERSAALESLARAGDHQPVIDVLREPGGAVDQLLEAIQIAGDVKIDDALGALIDLLESPEERVRLGAFVALIRLTGIRQFDYDPYGTAEERARGVEALRQWYKLRSGSPDR